MFNGLWEKLNGNKSLISSIVLLVLGSSYAEANVEAGLLDLLTQVAWCAFGGSMGHKVVKRLKK